MQLAANIGEETELCEPAGNLEQDTNAETTSGIDATKMYAYNTKIWVNYIRLPIMILVI